MNCKSISLCGFSIPRPYPPVATSATRTSAAPSVSERWKTLCNTMSNVAARIFATSTPPSRFSAPCLCARRIRCSSFFRKLLYFCKSSAGDCALRCASSKTMSAWAETFLRWSLGGMGETGNQPAISPTPPPRATVPSAALLLAPQHQCEQQVIFVAQSCSHNHLQHNVMPSKNGPDKSRKIQTPPAHSPIVV